MRMHAGVLLQLGASRHVYAGVLMRACCLGWEHPAMSVYAGVLLQLGAPCHVHACEHALAAESVPPCACMRVCCCS